MSNLKSFHALCRQHNISSSQYSISQRAHLGHFGLAYYLNNYADSVYSVQFFGTVFLMLVLILHGSV